MSSSVVMFGRLFLAIIVFSSSTLSPKETMYKIDQSTAFGIEVLLKHLPRIPAFLKFTERGTLMLAKSQSQLTGRNDSPGL